MALRFKNELNVYDEYGELLGQIEEGSEIFDPVLIANSGAKITPDELRELADYLENEL